MSKPTLKKPIGGPVTDEKGNRTWEWRSDTKIDTTVVRALGEELSIQDSSELPQSSNPYDRSLSSGAGEETQKRRTLDDMRRLSEKIKRSKHWTREK